MAKPDFVYIEELSGTGKMELNVDAEPNLGGTRGGSVHVKTASGLSKEVLISQNAAQQITFKPDAGSKLYLINDLSQPMSVDDYLIFQIILTENPDANNPGEYEVLDLFSFYGGLKVGQSVNWNPASPRSYFPKFKYLYGYGLVHSGLSPVWKDFRISSTSSSANIVIGMGNGVTQRPLGVIGNNSVLFQIMDRNISLTNCKRFTSIRPIVVPGGLSTVVVTLTDTSGGNVAITYIES